MAEADTMPFLITQDLDGNFRLTVRDIRYNSQGYPIVTGVLQDENFKTAAAAKTWARANFNAKAGQYATR
jgi:ketol-acid reductoisomerase